MSSNGAANIAEKSVSEAVKAKNNPLSANPASKDDDRIKPIEKSLTDDSNPLDDSNDFDDMESLLPSSKGVENGNSSMNKKGKVESLSIEDSNNGNSENNNTRLVRKGSMCCGLVRSTRSVGNMRILFPEYFHSSGLGVIGPHAFGPVVVWMLLLIATHGVLQGIYRHNLGIVSAIVSYLFLGVATFRLTDVSFRDPGICLDQEIPGHEPPDRASQYRFCDRCKVWQPPDGVHCPQCNVCVAGYDHHCVWMGTCIGKKNYRQFVKFNCTWVLYCMYSFFWVLTIGPPVMKK